MAIDSKGGGSRGSGVLRGALAAGVVMLLAVSTLYLLRANRVAAEVTEAQAAEGQAAEIARAEAEAIEAPGNIPPAEPAEEYLPRPDEREKRILTALEEPTQLDFVETPICEIVEYLQAKHGIPVQLDTAALRDVGIDREQVITIKVEGIRLASGLRLLLRDLDLTYVIENEVLLITTKERADVLLLTLVYPVADLIQPAGKSTAKYDFDSLIEVITANVYPSTWDEVGGPASITELGNAQSVVVSQTRENHEQVLRLLRALRAAKRMGAAP